MPFDKAKFLDELVSAGNLSAEARTAMETALNDGAVRYLEGGFLRQSDYTRAMNEAQQAQQRLEEEYDEKIQDIEALREQLANSSGNTNAENTALRAALTQAENDRLRIIQEARSRAGGEDFLNSVGLTDASIKYTPPPPKAKEEEKPQYIDAAKYSGDMRTMAEFVFDTQDWRDTYEDLTGKRLSAKELKEKLMAGFGKHKDTRDPYEIFRREFDIPGLEKTKEDNRINAMMEKARKEAVDEYISKQAIPSEGPTFKGGDDPFSKALQDERKDQTASNDNIVNEAVADFEKSVHGGRVN